MTKQEQIALGHKAENALEVLDLAFIRAREATIAKLCKISPARIDDIRGAHAVLQNIDAAREAVTQMIANGQMAKATPDD